MKQKSDNNNTNNITQRTTSLQVPLTDTDGEILTDERGNVMYRQVTNPVEIQQLIEEVTKEQNEDKARKARLQENKEKSGLSTAKNGYRSVLLMILCL